MKISINFNSVHCQIIYSLSILSIVTENETMPLNNLKAESDAWVVSFTEEAWLTEANSDHGSLEEKAQASRATNLTPINLKLERDNRTATHPSWRRCLYTNHIQNYIACQILSALFLVCLPVDAVD